MASTTSPGFKPGLGGRTVRGPSSDQRAGRRLHAERFRDLGRHRLEGGADKRPLEIILPLLCRIDDGAHHVGRNGEADADRAAAAAENRRVDADQLTGHVDQRAAGIAGIDRGVGLDEEAEVGNADMRCGPAPKRCRWSSSGRRRTGCRSPAPGRRPAARRNRRSRRPETSGVIDLEHGEVDALVLEQHLALEFPAVGSRDLDLVGVRG